MSDLIAPGIILTEYDGEYTAGPGSLQSAPVEPIDQPTYFTSKYIELAHEASVPEQVDGGGLGIAGANASIKYRASDDSFVINKDVHANVIGSCSYAANVAESNDVLVRGYLELHDYIEPEFSAISQDAVVNLVASNKTTFRVCTIVSRASISLSLPPVMSEGYIQHIIFINRGANPCTIVMPQRCWTPAASFVVSAGKARSIRYMIQNQQMIVLATEELQYKG